MSKRRISATPWQIVEDGWGVRLECAQQGIIALSPERPADDPDWLLLRAAPDLLAACQRVLANSEHGSWCPAITSSAPCACYYEVARQAVCKALGESL